MEEKKNSLEKQNQDSNKEIKESDDDISNSNQNSVHVYSHTNIVKRQRKPNSQYASLIAQ